MAQQIEHLVKMASQIALNLGAGHDEATAAHRTADHISHFWTLAMRRQLIAFWRSGGEVTPVLVAILAVLEATDGNGGEIV